MPTTLVRPEIRYAWNGSSVLIVNPRGECTSEEALTGFYYREARFTSTLQLLINGVSPWLCESAELDPQRLSFSYVHPELAEFGGGGTGQSDDQETTDARGVPHRSLALTVTYLVLPDGLVAELTMRNYSRRPIVADLDWSIAADFIDIQEAFAGGTAPRAPVRISRTDSQLRLVHDHTQLSYETRVNLTADVACLIDVSGVHAAVQLESQQGATIRLSFECRAAGEDRSNMAQTKDDYVERWRNGFTRISIPRNGLAERVLASNIRDIASFPLLEGPREEWLALQAGMPSYPALFGRDTLTAGWQAAFLDCGESLNASLTALGRLQSDRVYDWRDEEPGRIPYQIRRGPQAILEINPYAAYYADYASPLMFVIALAHFYAWTGDKAALRRHWDVARRILQWARTYGDKDRDGYLEYHTKSSKGTKNQGWKDSGDAIIYDDGRPVPVPIATCEIQGYWFAAQQLMSALCWVMNAPDEARAYWRSAKELKERFNRDWWVAEEGCIALAMDPDKRLVPAVTSNVGHCIATGIVNDEHLPPAVGRLFAPEMFSGWGIRTLSSSHKAYNPLSYHRGTVWAVEQATIAFGLRRFGFDARAADITRAMFDLAALYPEYRIPECVGGWSRGERRTPGAYPRANTPQLWNASAFPLLIHTMLGLQPVAPLHLLVVDPVLPDWLPEIVLEGIRLADATATLRFWRDRDGSSHAEVIRKQGTLRLVHQPPPESLTAGIRDRMSALVDTLVH